MWKPKFIPYQHIVKFSSPLIEGITKGKVHIFPKLDGGCTTAWSAKTGSFLIGGRGYKSKMTRHDSPHIYEHFDINREKYDALFAAHPDWVLYGEFGNRNVIRYYKDVVWGNYYIFDVVVYDENDIPTYIPYEEYVAELEKFGLAYIPCIAVIDGDTVDFNDAETLSKLFELAGEHFIDKDLAKGKPAEGIILKNYGYRNRHNMQIWAKIITSEFFGRKHKLKKDGTIDNRTIEQTLIDELLTDAFIEKEIQKIVGDNPWETKYIPNILKDTWEVWLDESILEIYDLLKKSKRYTVDFKQLYSDYRTRVADFLSERGLTKKNTDKN